MLGLLRGGWVLVLGCWLTHCCIQGSFWMVVHHSDPAAHSVRPCSRTPLCQGCPGFWKTRSQARRAVATQLPRSFAISCSSAEPRTQVWAGTKTKTVSLSALLSSIPCSKSLQDSGLF